MPKKKLIEVALPLEAINKASVREKSIRHGHPSTLHLWWARRPLASCRAVLFAQLVDDPSEHKDKFPTDEAQEKERQRLFKIIERLVQWENSNDVHVLEEARAEIRKSCGATLPTVYDPFSGGASIPLEAQRLGLPAQGSDLNPVAVMIGKAMVEFPPKFAGTSPINPQRDLNRRYKGAEGMADDVKYYGEWMQKEAEKRIGHLYPQIHVSPEMVKERPDLKPFEGQKLTAIAWIWTRTVPSPDPACNGAPVPLARSFSLSSKEGKEAWVEPIIDKNKNTYRFVVRMGKGNVPEGTVGRQGGYCIISGSPMPLNYIRQRAKAVGLGCKLLAIVAECGRGRVYLSPTEEQEKIALSAHPEWVPDTELPKNPRDFKTPNYGMRTFGELFTKRQLVALTTFSTLVMEAHSKILRDAVANGMQDDGKGLEENGSKATAYADAIAVYLAFAVDRSSNYWSSLTPWGGDFIVQTFGRQALPMVWDYAEGNPLSDSTGNWLGAIDWIHRVLNTLQSTTPGKIIQCDARKAEFDGLILCTDPPYYDNIGYADLSDFFYIWLRRSLLPRFPKLFATILVPKTEELIATPYRHGGREEAESYFLSGMFDVIERIVKGASDEYPTAIYYAFKQAETSDEGIVSTGWATFLDAVIRAGFTIDGTWPMRTERDQGLKTGQNVLASSIVLVCRKRAENAAMATRSDFIRALKRELPEALKQLQHANIEPVDIPQASIGPAIGIFSRYAKVIETDGTEMTVKAALALINKAVDEIRSEQDADFDDYTRFAVSWFEQYGMDSGAYGTAESIATARGISVNGVRDAGIIEATGGKVRILKRNELPENWDPKTDNRVTVWEVAQHLIRTLETGGEEPAAKLLKQVGGLGAAARELAYRLFDLCEKRKMAEEALAYNGLIKEWSALETKSGQFSDAGEARQGRLALG